MSIRKEYEKLRSMLIEAASPDKFNFKEVLQEAIVFFEKLRQEFPKASQEERDEMVQMMQDLQKKLRQITSEVSKNTGISEDEIYMYGENPGNYSGSEWQTMQDARKRLYDSARKFSQAMSESQEAESESPKDKKAPKKTARRSKRSKWMKS